MPAPPTQPDLGARPDSSARAGAMRILHLLPVLTGGGAERQLLYLSREQSQAGHEVHIAYMTAGPAADPEEWGHTTHHRVPPGPTVNPAVWWRVMGLMRSIRPDIVHTWIHQMDIVGGHMAALLRIPWLMREASSADCYPPTWRTRLRTATARHARMIISNSPGGDAFWAEQLPDTPRCVIRNGLPLEAIAGSSDDEMPPSLAGLSGPLLVFAGRLDPPKNVGRLIDALAEVMKDRPLTAVLCGDGVLRPALEEQIRGHGLEGRIILAGHQPMGNVWALMKRADIFALVSLFEGLPNVVMEAMACGAPLVVSDIAAHRDFLDDSCAVFVPVDDPAAMARGITDALETPRAESPRAAVALERARQWSIPEMARRYETAYRETIRLAGRR